MSQLPFHCEFSPISRGLGHNACRKSAYNAGEKIKDFKTGEIFNYGYKKTVVEARILLPVGLTTGPCREQAWNMVEAVERRWDSRLAREGRVSVPHMLSDPQKWELLLAFGRFIANYLSTWTDIAFHRPSRRQSDPRNDHGHLLFPTRIFDGRSLTKKHRHLDSQYTSGHHIEHLREQFADLSNNALREAGFDLTVDHRSYARQSISKIPGQHLGPAKFWQLQRLILELRLIDQEISAEVAAEERALQEKRLVTVAQLERAHHEIALLANHLRDGGEAPVSTLILLRTDGTIKIEDQFRRQISASIKQLKQLSTEARLSDRHEILLSCLAEFGELVRSIPNLNDLVNGLDKKTDLTPE